jgi:hypothetical protein
MPTVCEIRAELKAKGIKGYSGKNKAELMAMLPKATSTSMLEAAVPKLKAALEGMVAKASIRKPVEVKPASSVAAAAKPTAAHAIPVAVTAVAKAPIRKLVRKPVAPKPIVFTTPEGSPELEHLTLGRPAKAKKPEKAEEPKKVSAELRAKLHKDPFLLKAYNTVGGIDMLIEDFDKILSGEMKPLKGESRDFGRDVYDLGTFASNKWKKNANNVSTPKATEKLISQLPGGYWGLLILGTGDYDAWGEQEDVFMALLGKYHPTK